METLLHDICQTSSTCRHYAYMLDLLEKRMNKQLVDILATPHKSIHAINKSFPEIQTRKAFYAAICAITKHSSYNNYPHRDLWCQQAKLINEAVRERYESGNATNKQQDTFVPWSSVMTAFEEVKKLPEFPTKDHLLLAMYILEIPKRLDYGNVTIVATDELQHAMELYPSGNIIWIPNHKNHKSEAVLVLREYKTSKKYGTMEFKLSMELTRLIRISIHKDPRSHLFMSRGNREPMSDNVFAKFASRALSRWIEPGVTVNTLRHSIIKHVYENPSTTHKQRVELSRRMCHSIDMQSAYAYNVDNTTKS